MTNQNLTNNLQQFGLSKDEAKVFIATLELGGGYASTIAKKARVARVNCYHLLEKLTKKSLIVPVQRGKVQFFMPEPPQVFLNQQEQRFNRAKELLPELLSITNTHPFKPKIRAFEGLDGIKEIFNQTLKAESEILGYTNLEKLQKLLPDYLPEYVKKSLENKVKKRLISPKTDAATTHTKKYYPKNYPRELLEIFFVKPKQFPFENHISIYDNSVAIISLNPEEQIGVLIEATSHAKTQRTIFNLAWLGATRFVAQN